MHRGIERFAIAPRGRLLVIAHGLFLKIDFSGFHHEVHEELEVFQRTSGAENEIAQFVGLYALHGLQGEGVAWLLEKTMW
jgi:hypothetical protein